MRRIIPLLVAGLLPASGLADPPAASTKGHAPAKPAEAKAPANDAEVSTIPTSQIKDFASFPAGVQALIEDGLALTRRGLDYRYGSADPDNGGMDCSGTIYYLLRQAGVPHVPRQANLMYKWVWQDTRLYPVVSSNPKTFELADLLPGDLLFWSGTYDVDRDPPITHVMLYIGRSTKTGNRLMLGASSGRRYQGKARNGVSVFDFVLPRPNKDGSGPRFIGYGRVPNLPEPPPAPEPATPAPDAAAKPVDGPAIVAPTEAEPPKAVPVTNP